MTRDEQARQRLVEISIAAAGTGDYCEHLRNAYVVRTKAGFRDPSKGSWCAAGLTAAMEDAGLLVPAPGTPARRGAVALLDWTCTHGSGVRSGGGRLYLPAPGEEGPRSWDPRPGDIIAWKQNPPPETWMQVADVQHAFATAPSRMSMCGKGPFMTPWPGRGPRCSSCVWETRKGHVALIVKVDDVSITTVGWNEGPSPGRVMKRRLCRRQEHAQGYWADCPVCDPDDVHQSKSRSSTVLWRRPGGLYGIARPVAA